MRRSGLIVEVPAAEPAVGPWRAELDPLASRGVPAHVTVLFPFIPASAIDAHVHRRLGELFGSVSSFGLQLVEIRWFGDTVMWLGPDADADARFRQLTGLVEQAWPDYPPYGGAFDDAVPHLTVGDRAPVARMRAAARQLSPVLPIRATGHAITLMREQPDGHWVRDATFPLGSGPGL